MIKQILLSSKSLPDKQNGMNLVREVWKRMNPQRIEMIWILLERSRQKRKDLIGEDLQGSFNGLGSQNYPLSFAE